MTRLLTFATIAAGSGTCSACDEPLPVQLYRGNPRKYGCEACRVWAHRHPGQSRECGRCVRPADDRSPQQIRIDQRAARSLATRTRHGRAGSEVE